MREFIKSKIRPAIGLMHRLFLNNLRNLKDQNKPNRFLEIGPGVRRIPDFETLNVVWNRHIDYIHDATKPMPFPDETFDLVYASHILEHIAWYKVGDVLKDWARILKKGGKLEIWVPDGLKICRAFVDGEAGERYFEEDGFWRFNNDRDPCVWASGRIYTYGDGTGNINHPNWHHALFSERYLRKIFVDAGLENVTKMELEQMRGPLNHKWINLGISGEKP